MSQHTNALLRAVTTSTGRLVDEDGGTTLAVTTIADGITLASAPLEGVVLAGVILGGTSQDGSTRADGGCGGCGG